jgi:5-methylcytosine-specific restriction endonuclease McrA
MNKQTFEQLFKEIIDYLSPLQTPTEQAVYNYLFRWSVAENQQTIQIGERSLADSVARPAKGKLSKSKGLSYSTIRSTLRDLEAKGHIKVLEVHHKGKIIKINTPTEIETCRKNMQKKSASKVEPNYFKDPEKRKELFERDKWTCFYCGEKVVPQNATLDHYEPQCKGGGDNKENLKTCCVVCNSIKSGRTYEEAAPLLLKSMQERRNKL